VDITVLATEAMPAEQLERVLLLGAFVLLTAVVAVRLSSRTGLPSLLIYVGFGLLLGVDVGGIEFDNAELTQVLGYAALIIILAEGGLTTNWSRIRRAVPAAAALATVGVGISMAVTAVFARWLLDVDWRTALLLGAIVSSTDAAAVFSVLRRLPLPSRLTGILEAESGFNDAPAVILVTALSLTPDESGGIYTILWLMVVELSVGLVVGLVVGRLGAAAVRRVALPASGLYPIAVLALVVIAYSIAAILHGSGFLAVYLASLVLGNSRLPHGPATRGFAEGLAWLAQIGLFVLLGLLATPHQLDTVILPALGVGFGLLLVARPLSVLLCATPFRVPLREQALLSWAGLRGAVPIVLATVPLVAEAPHSRLVFNLVFVLVVAFTLLQGPTLPAAARWLKVVADHGVRDIDVESAPLERLDAHLLQVRIGESSRLHGVEVAELRLPHGAAVTLVVRDGSSFVPSPTTMLRHGDELLLVATTAVQWQAERRLRAVSRRGRLAGWHSERRR
jgi:cell volume regulation protein A